MPNPMHQFEIRRYIPWEVGGVDVSFTNSAAVMVAAVVVISAFLILSVNNKSLIPSRAQSVAELIYEFVANIVRDAVGPAGQKYFPFIFTLFSFILVVNMLGMLPFGHFAFTPTSHIIITFALAALVFIGVTVIGFWKNGIGYLKLFAPSGVPWYMLPIIIPIEVISYLTRPISLSVRLFANMMVGHTLLKVLGGFVAMLGLAGAGPLLLMIPFTGLEVLVAFLQAFVFAVLTCIYLNDALNLHDAH
jgi:F-type H+-transporting ATPase subunit a